MDPASLPADLDETARQALQASLPSAVICTIGLATCSPYNSPMLAEVRPDFYERDVGSAFP